MRRYSDDWHFLEKVCNDLKFHKNSYEILFIWKIFITIAVQQIILISK